MQTLAEQLLLTTDYANAYGIAERSAALLLKSLRIHFAISYNALKPITLFANGAYSPHRRFFIFLST